MRMKEYKSIKVSPQEEVDTIELYQTFGWVIEDSREVYCQGYIMIDRTVANESGVKTQRVTNYITLRFVRDNTMPNYYELKKYEDEYFAEPLRKQANKLFGSKTMMTIATILAIVSIIFCVLSFSAGNVGFGMVSLIVLAVCIGLWTAFIVSRNKRGKVIEYNRRIFEEKAQRRVEIIAKCRELLDESHC